MNATTKELKKETFKAKQENIKETIDRQFTFILKIKPQNHIFQQNVTNFGAGNATFLNLC